jgi:hypothetical protein
MVLLILLVQFVSGGPDSEGKPGEFVGLLVLVFLVAFLSGDPNTIGLFFYVALIILAIILIPLLIALGYSIWAGTRPSAPGPVSVPRVGKSL